MATLRTLNLLLGSAGRTLDEAARQIHEAPLPPPRANVDRIAAALSQIFDLQYEIYALDPSLAPASLAYPTDKPVVALDYASRRAQEFEKAGQIEVALAFFQLFLRQGADDGQGQIAAAEVERLRHTKAT